jgi:hypothetical protein
MVGMSCINWHGVVRQNSENRRNQGGSLGQSHCDVLRETVEPRCWGYKKALAASSYQSLGKSCPLFVERHQTAKYPAFKLLHDRFQQL